jgi:hypothetical protein
MLEERINVLIQSIDILNVHLQRLWDAKDEIKGEKAPADQPKVKTEPKETKPKDKPVAVTELEGLCLEIIREKGPKFKKKIKNTIAAHGGTLISDCPEANLGTLKTALEAL